MSAKVSPTSSADGPHVSSTPVTKPIKLRSACNSCFAAKVRCNGNKTGCARCSERKVPCKYSESKVGKVVGRRRRRHFEESVGTVHSAEWIIPKYEPFDAMPSPADSATDDSSSERNSLTRKTSTTDSYNFEDFMIIPDDMEERQPSVDSAYFRLDTFSTTPYSGLPTPAVSPPLCEYTSVAMIENRPAPSTVTTPMVVESYPVPESHPVSINPSFNDDRSQFLTPGLPRTLCRRAKIEQADDAETTCLKLLMHFKKRNTNQDRSVEESMVITRKSIAVLRRLLKDKGTRSNYACQILLSSILLHVVESCEIMSQKYPQTAFRSPVLQPELCEPDGAANFHELVAHAAEVTGEITALLMRKPLDGFQAIGRHEAMQLDMGRRLKICVKQLL